MHMADALISPAVGGAMWAATAGLTVYCSRELEGRMDERKAPLMGILGAFVFSAQMINFWIPGTGSSGHLGGGMLLAILLGPHAAFLTIASVLVIQALFFGDGGLLALGCNVFNLGFFPCFVAYPLIYKRIAGAHPGQGRIVFAATLAAVIGLQLGALGVVLETTFSGISELPFRTFVLFMLPIHLAIGVVEGLVTAATVSFVWRARPEVLELQAPAAAGAPRSFRGVLAGLAVATLITGGLLSWFASSHPDGLEWSMFRVSGQEELEAPEKGAHHAAGKIQSATALLPDYDFKSGDGAEGSEGPEADSVVHAGTSLAGVVGSMMTLAIAGLLAFLFRARAKAD